MSIADVLVIDDEEQIRKLLEITLQSNNYRVKEAITGKEGLSLASVSSPDIILLDLGLPDQSGYEVLQKLRIWYTKPIIILSVKSDEESIVKALDHGANDYMVKPFRTGELLARIRSALRNTETDIVLITSGNLKIDLSLRVVLKKEEVVKLTATEYQLLTLLAKNEGRVLTHQYLLREVWGAGYITQSQYLRVFIAQLRKKIEDDPNRPQIITTESGVGYRFVSKE